MLKGIAKARYQRQYMRQYMRAKRAKLKLEGTLLRPVGKDIVRPVVKPLGLDPASYEEPGPERAGLEVDADGNAMPADA